MPGALRILEHPGLPRVPAMGAVRAKRCGWLRGHGSAAGSARRVDILASGSPLRNYKYEHGERLPAFVAGAGGCWIWTRGLDTHGYASKRAEDGDHRTVRVHREIWETLNGPVPSGLDLDHLCRKRLCVNPSHLEPVTRKENILRGSGAAALHARKTHCKRGHEFSAHEAGKGWRRCKTCHRMTHRLARLARKARATP